ncbi:UNVERIFIED_CONTAM: hypothetical protein GTU68_036232 [Idotea baltica]|nr:hypothetical protein [Idotea baltica]
MNCTEITTTTSGDNRLTMTVDCSKKFVWKGFSRDSVGSPFCESERRFGTPFLISISNQLQSSPNATSIDCSRMPESFDIAEKLKPRSTTPIALSKWRQNLVHLRPGFGNSNRSRASQKRKWLA